MTFWKWSTTAASNDTADSTINLREGMAPSAVNDSNRAMMAAAAKYRDDQSGNLVTGGTSTAYTLTTNQVFTSLTDGISVTCRMSATSGATPTLNVDSLGAKSIAGLYGTAIPTGALASGSVQKFVYDSTDDKWIVHGRQADYYSVGGTDVPVTDGGTGASTAANARTNLGVTATGADTTYNFRANNLSDVASAATAFTNIKQAASDTATGVIEIAVQSEMETATDTTRAVVPGRQHNHPGHPKFWAYVTYSGGTPTLAASYNVTSITDGGTGALTVTIATDFSSANWCCSIATTQPGGNSIGRVSSQAAGSVDIIMRGSASGTADDPDACHVVGFGDQ